MGRFAQQSAAGTDYFLADALGSVRQITDSSGFPSMYQSFDPFGNLLARTGAASSSFGFAGEWTDATGLQYLRARYYSPAQGRFLTKDPFLGMLKTPASLHFYIYALNNPVLYTDPSGRIIWIPAILAIGAVVGGLGSMGAYLLNTPSRCISIENVLVSFGAGALAGLVGTGATMIVVAILPVMGPPWIAGAIAGGMGGAASTVVYNAMTGEKLTNGIGIGILIGAVSGGLAADLRFPPHGPIPELSWTRGWPLRNANVGKMSLEIVFGEISQESISSFLAIFVVSKITRTNNVNENLPRELYWMPDKD